VRRLLVVCLLLAAIAVPVALLGLSAPPARADGDPASDFLLTYQVFYPYYSNTPKDSLTKLKQTVADANKRGYRIRVAVITSPYDLGSVSALWEKPKAYAGFLAEELAFVYRGRLLIVSPKGYGYNEGTRRVGTTYVVRPSPKTLALVRTVPIGKGTDGLLKTADRAVRLLAARDGIKLPATSGSTGSGSGSSMDTIVIALAAALGALLLVGFEVLRRRRRRQRASGEPEGAHLS
jgi:MYXO-CTERM domain-containing protein